MVPHQKAPRRANRWQDGLDVSTPRQIHGPTRWLFLGLGIAFVGVGGVGVVVPGLPTTPFMILAVWAFARSSQRFHDWLYHHRVFGPSIQRWHRHRAIPLGAKLASLTAMIATFAMLVWRGASPLVLVLIGLVCGWGAWFIWRCPSRAPE